MINKSDYASIPTSNSQEINYKLDHWGFHKDEENHDLIHNSFMSKILGDKRTRVGD